MATDDRTAEQPPARGEWLWQRVANLPADVRERCVRNAASTSQASLVERAEVPDRTWGFATNTPSLTCLLEAAQHAPPHSLTHEEGYLATLKASRTFNSPDCVEAMAEAYGLSDSLAGLRGTVVGPGRSEAEQEAVQQVRAALKQDIRRAWAEAAVRRGIGLAKSGNAEGALQCYNRALDLEPGLVDAWVARGALRANSGNFGDAVSDFETALGLDPSHQNAAKYLKATRAKVAQQATPSTRQLSSRHTPLNGEISGASPRRADARARVAQETALAQPRPSATRDSAGPWHGAPLGDRAGPDRHPGERDPDSGNSTTEEDSSAGRGRDPRGPAMDLKTALHIVSKHFDRRKSSRKKSRQEKKSKKRKKKRKRDESESRAEKKSHKKRDKREPSADTGSDS